MSDTQQKASRPSPEALLELAKAEGRGRLKIFLGAAPGVGKTYEMLTAGRRLKEDGVDVVVAVVETHGRRETAALVEGLEILPRRSIPYKGRVLEEMDLDALLLRRPKLALVDELAHENAYGSRHPKRWMDVEELLSVGIDVYSTLNVQHIESLVDVVARITRVQVRETVPDSVIDAAQVEVVDLTPEELRERLADGKVYIPEQAKRALDHYFSPGNLTALREMALRRTADRVDDQMVQYMQAHGLAGPWAAGERLLVCVHGGPGAAELVRYTKRVADRQKGSWTAINVRSSRRLSEIESDRIADTLRLAERLGAETLVLPGGHIADEVLAWARGNNVTQIVIGSARRAVWFEWLKGSLPRDLIRGAGDIIVHVLPESGETVPAKVVKPRETKKLVSPIPYIAASAFVGIATGCAMLLERWIDLSNISLVFLLPVILASQWFGLLPGLLASVLATISYNYFFTEPLYTFAVSEPENITAIIFFSVTAIFTSTLSAQARERTITARRESVRTAALFSFTKKLTAVATRDDLLWACSHQMASMLHIQVVVLLPGPSGLALAAAYPPEDHFADQDLAAAAWCWEHDHAAGRGSDTLPGAERLFLPLRTGRGRLGVVGIRRSGSGPLLTPDERRLLDALLDQTAVALERIDLAQNVDETRLLGETEKLRTALLTSLSHDVKTPLASILGTISSLRSFGPLYDENAREEMLATAQEEAERLSRYLDNLLDMTRLEGGALGPKREPVDLADAVGSALRRMQRMLSGHRVVTAMPPDLPMLALDFVLLEQILVNLLENAARYAPRGSTITVRGAQAGDEIHLDVEDEGIGLPAEEARLIFDKFYRGTTGEGIGSGTGLGLAVCKGFAEAMGGTIEAVAGRPRGTLFRLTFPASLTVTAPVEA